MSSLLVVDDEPGICESLEYFFSSQGHQTFVAPGLGQALDLAERHKPDAIVSDLMFDGGTGLELREELNRRHRSYNPGFILMSGKATLPSAIEAVKLGVDQFLLKPLDLNELNAALDLALQKRQKVSHELKVRFQLAEQFYHDLSLPFNQLIPRLCMLLEGRHGNLGMAQIQSLSGQFEYLRQMLWVMKGFYPRLLEGQGSDLKRQALDANHMAADALAKFEDEFYRREVETDFRVSNDARVVCHREMSQALIEITLTRALAIAAKGSKLGMSWSSEGRLLILKVELHTPDSRSAVVAPLIQMVPMSLTCLEQAGLSFDCESPAGPWRIGFNIENN